MIKKLFLFSVLVFISFFMFKDNVYANVHTGISYDCNDKFNIFYEIKNNSPMANLLLSKDINSLQSYLGIENASFLTISYVKDFYPYLLDGKSFPSGSKYIIFFQYKDQGLPTIKRNANDYSYTYSHLNRFVILDEDMNLLVSSKDFVSNFLNNNYQNELTFTFSGTSKNSIEDFTYFISHLWYSSSPVNMYGMFEDTYVTDVLYDDDRLYIDDSDVNQNIFTKIKYTWLDLIGSESLIDPNQLYLSYFQKNNYMTSTTSPPDIYTILNNNYSVVPPNGFTSLNFKLNDKKVEGYLFIPKNVNTLMNRNLYGYTSDLPPFGNGYVKQGISGFLLNSNNTISSLGEKNVDYFHQYKQNYRLYNLNYEEKLSNIYADFNYKSTAIWVSHAIKYNSILYYNPNAFQVCTLYTTGSDVDEETGSNIFTYGPCTFTNPITGEETTLSGNDFYNTISSTNTIGASVDIWESDEDELGMYNEYSELYDYDDNGNITGFSVSGVLNDLKVFLTSFISVISTIFSFFTLFFNSLPLEIRSLLYFTLIGGAILLFWKLIK